MASNFRPRVLVTNTGVIDEAVDLLKKYCDVTVNEIPTQESILLKVPGVDAILAKPPTLINKELLDAAGPQLKTVATTSRGNNFMDFGELKKRGIKYSILTNQNASAVADSAVMLLLAAGRRLHEGRLAMKRSEWMNQNKQWMLGQDLHHSTVGLIGFGEIGQMLVKRLDGFDIEQFLYSAPREKKEAENLGVKFVSQDTLLSRSDFVVIACPLTKDTNHMCNEEFFSKMKKSAIFVNIARGGIVDQPALINALKNGEIFAAGLDVMTPEPLPSDHELMKLPNVVLTPHIAFKTRNTVREVCIFAAKNILKELNVGNN